MNKSAFRLQELHTQDPPIVPNKYHHQAPFVNSQYSIGRPLLF